MPRVALYETLVLSLCNALVGSIVAQLGPFSVDATFVALVALSWFASMLLVWWRVVLRGRMRFTWPGCVAAAIVAGLLGHLTFYLLSLGMTALKYVETMARVASGIPFLVFFMFGSLALYGVQTVFFGVLLGILLFVWKKKARGLPTF
ncbi:hypothetical protein [Desulfovibrio aminophilus]|uniref:hypothetical protein n=1 Tax=Desulfovibrio aminophilus TaxID=81425 RepID=UPI003395E95E